MWLCHQLPPKAIRWMSEMCTRRRQEFSGSRVAHYCQHGAYHDERLGIHDAANIRGLVLPIPALSLTDLLRVLSTPSLASSSRMTEIFPHEYYARDQIAGIDPNSSGEEFAECQCMPSPFKLHASRPIARTIAPIPHARPILGYSGKIFGKMPSRITGIYKLTVNQASSEQERHVTPVIHSVVHVKLRCRKGHMSEMAVSAAWSFTPKPHHPLAISGGGTN
ncbi:hypothetical protein H4582DRAFT_2056185 [Lactarius indigo]|nr:hypothetical protein H4582DRAFT_2056185 [Lactarius indigo]